MIFLKFKILQWIVIVFSSLVHIKHNIHEENVVHLLKIPCAVYSKVNYTLLVIILLLEKNPTNWDGIND